MADSSVPITAGTGTNIDTFTQAGGDHRQAMVVGDASAAYTAQVGVSGGLSVRGASIASQTLAITAATPVTGTGLSVSEAGNVTFVLKNTTAGTAWTGTIVTVFEQSDDNTSWSPLSVSRGDNNAVSSTHTFYPLAANTELMMDAALEGVAWVRARVTTAQSTNGATFIIQPGGLSFSPVVSAVLSSVRPSAINVTGNAANQTAPASGGTGLVHVSGTATVAATALVASPGAGLSIYVTDVETINAGGAAQIITLFEGTTNARLVRYMAPAGGGGVTNLRTPWKLPVATALGYSVTTNAAQYYMTVSYFVAP